MTVQAADRHEDEPPEGEIPGTGAPPPAGGARSIPRFPSTPSPADILEALDHDGLAIVEGALTAEEVAHKRAVAEGLFDTTPMGRNAFEGYRTQRVYGLFAKTRAFDDVAVDPLLVKVLDETLRHYQLSGPVAVQIGAGEQAQILHYDEQVYPVPWPRPHLVLNVVLALCDFTEANGATRVAPGSHRWDRDVRPTPGDTVPAEMEAGSMLLYVGSLWHGGGANRTDQPRPAVLVEYAASWLRQQETQVLAVPRETVRDLPPKLQELLGYSICPPFLGYVDGRHPRNLLDG